MRKYRINDSSILIISDNVIIKFCKYYQTGLRYESGGILIGKISSDYSVVVITDITIPTNKDKRSKYSFVRNKNSNQGKLDEIWAATERESQYLGEWHTHPEESPQPSTTDIDMIKECIKINSYNYDGLFLMIVGFTGSIFVGYIDNSNQLEKMEEMRDA